MFCFHAFTLKWSCFAISAALIWCTFTSESHFCSKLNSLGPQLLRNHTLPPSLNVVIQACTFYQLKSISDWPNPKTLSLQPSWCTAYPLVWETAAHLSPSCILRSRTVPWAGVNVLQRRVCGHPHLWRHQPTDPCWAGGALPVADWHSQPWLHLRCCGQQGRSHGRSSSHVPTIGHDQRAANWGWWWGGGAEGAVSMLDSLHLPNVSLWSDVTQAGGPWGRSGPLWETAALQRAGREE